MELNIQQQPSGETVEDLITQNPARIKFFNQKNIDYSWGADQSIAKVLANQGYDRDVFFAEMGQFEAENKDLILPLLPLDLQNLSVPKLLDNIQGMHHFPERKLLFEIDKFLNKIMQVHFDHHGEVLMKLHDQFADLKKELEVHLVKEDELYFPAIRLALETKAVTPEHIANFKDLEEDHKIVGEIIHEIQTLTDKFTPPADACMTYAKTFGLLEELTESLLIHVYKENFILIDALQRSVN